MTLVSITKTRTETFVLSFFYTLRLRFAQPQGEATKAMNLHEYMPNPLQQLTAADRSAKHRIWSLRIREAGYGTAMAENDFDQDWIQSEPFDRFGRQNSSNSYRWRQGLDRKSSQARWHQIVMVVHGH